MLSLTDKATAMHDQTIALLIERIERCEMELQSARAYIKALEQGLHAAIVTHGDPLRMGEFWGHVLVEIAEGQTDGPGLVLFHFELV